LAPAAYAAARPLVRNPTLIALATAAIVRSALPNGCAADTSPQYRHGASNHPPYRTSSVTKALGGEYDGFKGNSDEKNGEIFLEQRPAHMKPRTING
jgi:hypothetical protein